jgi:hypothetical protein
VFAVALILQYSLSVPAPNDESQTGVRGVG